MICRPCAEAADVYRNERELAVKAARALHAECVGCDCQHKVGAKVTR